jgi:hypothetical protein
MQNANFCQMNKSFAKGSFAKGDILLFGRGGGGWKRGREAKKGISQGSDLVFGFPCFKKRGGYLFRRRRGRLSCQVLVTAQIRW